MESMTGHLIIIHNLVIYMRKRTADILCLSNFYILVYFLERSPLVHLFIIFALFNFDPYMNRSSLC